MRELSIKDKQAILLRLLKAFDKFAKENGILYFVCSGSCLGAVREGGFIPWDGDVDIVMPLEMYKKCEELLIASHADDIRWISYKTDKKAPNLMGRVYEKDVDFRHFEEYPYLDIFALVGMPSNIKTQKKIMDRSLRNYRIYWIKKRDYLKSLNRKKSRIGLALKILLLLYPSKICIRRFEKDFTLFNYDECDYVAAITGLYGQKEVMPKEWFEKPTYVKFCDTHVPVSCFYKDYLKHMYGDDYMTPVQFNRYKDNQ